MAKRIVTKIGNVFVAKFDHCQKYFQYVANDMTQLNSSVIRVFKKEYPLDSSPDLNEVVAGEIDFYTHVVLRWGIEGELWEKVGKAPVIGEIDVIFRDTNPIDVVFGKGDKIDVRFVEEDNVEISHRWNVWRINKPMKFVGDLKGENRKAEIGVVQDPLSVYERMRTGKWRGKYPGFE